MGFHTDGVLFKNSFGTPEMREVFSEETFIERFLEVEAALARAEADVGLVPQAAAEEITDRATIDEIDLSTVETNVAEISLFTMAIIGPGASSSARTVSTSTGARRARSSRTPH